MIDREQKPVWVEVTTNTGDKFILDPAVEADKIRAAKDVGLSVVPLYTAPPQREWQGLTTQEIADETDIATSSNKDIFDLRKAFWCGARWAEAKLKEKNT